MSLQTAEEINLPLLLSPLSEAQIQALRRKALREGKSLLSLVHDIILEASQKVMKDSQRAPQGKLAPVWQELRHLILNPTPPMTPQKMDERSSDLQRAFLDAWEKSGDNDEVAWQALVKMQAALLLAFPATITMTMREMQQFLDLNQRQVIGLYLDLLATTGEKMPVEAPVVPKPARRRVKVLPPPGSAWN